MLSSPGSPLRLVSCGFYRTGGDPMTISSTVQAEVGGEAALALSRDSRTAASSQAHEACMPLVGDASSSRALHAPLLRLPLDTDPI